MPIRRTCSWLCLALAAALCALGFSTAYAEPTDFSRPWLNEDRALVIDAYEYNGIDWQALVSDKRIAGFINKASDGLEPAYFCSGGETEYRLCKALWKRHAVARELFHTRRALARSFGLKWGAYHLGRPGNPIDQANHFLEFAEPGPDDMIALDIEDNDAEQFMSLEDAEVFARHIHRRTGRYPVLYTNGSTARYIADNRDRYRVLSRLPLWYARYKPEIDAHFPKGHWESYTLWQFASRENCNATRCPYRVPGTGHDIDVNVAAMSPQALREAWPFPALIDAPVDLLAQVPVPVSRALALAGKAEVGFAPVRLASIETRLKNVLDVAGERYPNRKALQATEKRAERFAHALGLAEVLASIADIERARGDPDRAILAERDTIRTGALRRD